MENHTSSLYTPVSTPNVPDELLFEILSRLPVKSLLRFKCVMKSWCSLISSRRFIKIHLNILSNDDDYTHHKIMYGIDYPTFRSSTLQSALNAPLIEMTDIDQPVNGLPGPSTWFVSSCGFVGSCNGLVCIKTRGDFFLWNPSIRKSKKLPRPGSGSTLTSAFGYDNLNDDYKVVGVYERETKLYSCKSDSWRAIDDHLYSSGRYLPINTCTFASGKFYSIKIYSDIGRIGGDPYKIVVKIFIFDLGSETSREVDYPDSPICASPELGALGGRLTVLHPRNNGTDIWIMMESGGTQSWTKVGMVPFPGEIGRPVFLSKKGEIMLNFGSALVLYHPKHDPEGCREIKLRQPFYPIHTAATYVESLVWPEFPSPPVTENEDNIHIKAQNKTRFAEDFWP